MKVFFISILAGIGTALVGWGTSVFLAETLFTGLSRDGAIVCGWATYLCIIIVVCTGVVLSKTKK